VFLYIQPPVGEGGRYSLAIYPRRRGDTKVYVTRPGCSEAHGLSREVRWTPVGLGQGLQMMLIEKNTSPGKGFFQGQPPFRHGDPPRLSGRPVKGAPPQDVAWEYEVLLSDGQQILARLDPEIIIIPEP
jgi:hypothetical protein